MGLAPSVSTDSTALLSRFACSWRCGGLRVSWGGIAPTAPVHGSDGTLPPRVNGDKLVIAVTIYARRWHGASRNPHPWCAGSHKKSADMAWNGKFRQVIFLLRTGCETASCRSNSRPLAEERPHNTARRFHCLPQRSPGITATHQGSGCRNCQLIHRKPTGKNLH